MNFKITFMRKMKLLVLLAASCSVLNVTAEEKPLRVYGNTSTIEIAPVLVAINQGLYSGPVVLRNGGVPNLHGREEASPIWDVGTADVATNAETQLLRYSVEHPDMRIILTVSEGLYRIVAKRSAGINSLADLKGKRIATIQNTSSKYFLHKMLLSGGLSIDDVEIESMYPLDNFKTALTEDGFDAVTVWEPGADYAAQSIGDDLIEFKDKSIYRELFNLNTTVASLEDPEMRAKIVEFVKSLILASKKIAQQPEIAWPLVAKSSGLSEEVVGQVWKHHDYPGILVDDVLDVLEQEEVWVSRETDRTPRTRSELATLIDSSIYEEAIRTLE